MTKAHGIKKQKVHYRWLVLILILFCQLMVHAWIRTESTQTMLRISRIQSGTAKSLSYGKALGVERDRLKSDARITRIATTRLGLSTDILNQTIYLPKGNL